MLLEWHHLTQRIPSYLEHHQQSYLLMCDYSVFIRSAVRGRKSKTFRFLPGLAALAIRKSTFDLCHRMTTLCLGPGERQ